MILFGIGRCCGRQKPLPATHAILVRFDPQILLGPFECYRGYAVSLMQRDWRNDQFTWEAIKDAINELLEWLEPGGELIPPPPEVAKRFGSERFPCSPMSIGGFVSTMINLEFWGNRELITPKNAREHAILASLKAARRNLIPKDALLKVKEENGK